MTITTLNILENGTLADVAPVNENFETLRVGINSNESSINALDAGVDDLVAEVGTLSGLVMPDLSFDKTDQQFMIANDKSSLKIKAGTVIRLEISPDDVRFLNIEEDTVYNIFNIMDTGVSSLTAGRDYYIFVVKKDVTDPETNEVTKTVELKASLNATYPTGYSAINSRKIGGFHTLCLAVTSANAPAQLDGTQHPAIGYNAGDVIPNSVWCLSHRPQSEPNGMVYVTPIDKWADIYLQGGKDGNPTSVFGATLIDSRQQPNHQWDMQVLNKRLASDNDFNMLAEGSNQRTAISGSASPTPKTAGGHVDTAGKRMISKFFVEECCGYLWQWLDASSANGGSGFSTYDGTGLRGQTFGASYCLVAGGDWSIASSCGSRSRYAGTPRSNVAANIGGRGVSLPLRV